MTLLHSPDDELLSAYLDGAGTEADALHIEACPACQSRLRELRSVATAVGGPGAVPDPGRRDQAVAAALAVRDAGRRLADLGRRVRHPMVPLVAALIALVVLVPMLLLGNDDSKTPDDASELGTAARQDLGPHDTPEELATDLQNLLTGAAPPPPDERLPCDDAAVALGRGRLGERLLSATLRWQGTPAVVHVFRAEGDANLSRQAYVLAVQGCEVLAFQSF